MRIFGLIALLVLAAVYARYVGQSSQPYEPPVEQQIRELADGMRSNKMR